MNKAKNILFSIAVIIAFFALLEGVSRFFIPPGSYDFIERRAIEQDLAHKKAKDEYRILFYGESTMHGNQLYPKSTIDQWLKLYLAELLPENIASRVTTTNFGRLGASSGFIADSFIETIPYKPDLAVFYMAHNGFTLVPQRRALFTPLAFGHKAEKLFKKISKKSSFINAVNRAYIRHKINRKRRIAAKAEAPDRWYTENPGRYYSDEDLLDPQSEKFDAVRENFERNVDRIIKAAKKHDIPVIFFEAVAKWKGYAPVESVHDASLTGKSLEKWDRIFKKGEDAFKSSAFPIALDYYRATLALDENYALTYYRIAECYEALGNAEEANRYYKISNDKDHFPIRAPSCVNEFYEELRGENKGSVYVIKTQQIFEENSKNGIINDELVLDPIHPTMKGQALMALEVARVICGQGLLAPKSEWDWEKVETDSRAGLSLPYYSFLKAKLKIDEEFEFTMYITSAQYVEKRYDKATEFLEKAVRIKPDSVFAKSWLAWAYWNMGRKERAARLYKELYEQSPELTDKFLLEHSEIERMIRGNKGR